ncbi:MAG TPA: HEAT repeat domain-containing protein [Roseiflexaceae bacterium]|nr:HEAT repeat domain-containing protein [Roseiflexaceae bacterium]
MIQSARPPRRISTNKTSRRNVSIAYPTSTTKREQCIVTRYKGPGESLLCMSVMPYNVLEAPMTLPPPDVIGAIAGAVFGYLLEQTDVAGRVRQQLGLDPMRRAFGRALERAIGEFKRQHPRWYAELFDASFLQHEGAPVLAELLLRDGVADPSELADRWAVSLNIRDGEQRSHHTRALEPVAATLLELLGHELKAEGELRELHNDRALEQMSETIARLAERHSAGRATPGTRRDYLRWLIGRNLYLDPRGSFQTQRQVQLRLDEVYIGLCARPDEHGDPADKAMLERELAALEQQIAGLPADEAEDQREDLRALLLRRARAQMLSGQTPVEQRQELAEVVAAHPRLVILGDPGGGKSTLLRFLALRHAEALRDRRAEAENGLGRARFPILLRIADYAEHGLDRPLSDWLAEATALHECPRSGLADLLAEELRQGGCLVLLDGLDEIVSPDDRQTVLERIEEFVRRHNHSDNRFVVTSRPAGYRRALLSGDLFEHYSVQEMDEEQIRRFLERWCRAVEDAQAPDAPPERRQELARREIDGIMQAVATPGVRRLAANPLLLRILALIYRTGAQLPQKRIELYKLAADTLARTWRAAQGVPETALVQEEYLNPLLSRLAYWMQAHKPTGLASEREVYAVLGAEWAEIHDEDWNPDRPSPKINEQISNFLLRVREHTGLFVERAPGIYGFINLTFQEYYAARYLVANNFSRAQLSRQHLHDPRWDEPILLALSFVSLYSTKEATELLESAVLAQGSEATRLGLVPGRHEELLGRDYLFALRCLSDQIPIRLRLLRPLIERLAQEILGGKHVGFRIYGKSLEQRLEALNGEAAHYLALLLSDGLREINREVRLRAVVALGSLVYVEGVVDMLRSVLQEDKDPYVRDAVVWVIGGLGNESEWIAALHHTSSKVRISTLEVLGGLRDVVSSEVVIRAIRVSLLDNNPTIRASAVRTLGRLEVQGDWVVNDLRAALDDPDPIVRISAVEVLRKVRNQNGMLVAVLCELVNHNDLNVRYGVACILGRLEHKREEMLALIRIALEDDNDIRRSVIALRNLGRMGCFDEDVLMLLRSALGKDAPVVRVSVVEALERIGCYSKEVLDVFRIALSDSDADVRFSVVRAIGRMKYQSEDVVSVLRVALEDTESRVRIAAVRSLGVLGAMYEVTMVLHLALGDQDLNVCYAAAGELGILGEVSDDLLSLAIRGLSDAESCDAREQLAIYLGRRANATPSVIDALLKGLVDNSNYVCRACAAALARLGRRFPDQVTQIEQWLLHTISHPTFADQDQANTRIHYNYAREALWLLVMDEEEI